MSEQRKIWVAAPPHADPRLKGLATTIKPWQRNRRFTENPECVILDSNIARMLIRGDLIEVDPHEIGDDQ